MQIKQLILKLNKIQELKLFISKLKGMHFWNNKNFIDEGVKEKDIVDLEEKYTAKENEIRLLTDPSSGNSEENIPLQSK